MIIRQSTKQIIATAFANGGTHDFRLFKESRIMMVSQIVGLADSGYQGLVGLHSNSRTPKKKSKHHSLTPAEKAANRELAQQRIFVEHVIGKIKVFRIMSERYRNRRKRFGLRFNLIAAIYNLELS